MCSKRAVPFATLGRMCLKGDAFFTRELLFQDGARVAERPPGSVTLGAAGLLRARAGDPNESELVAVLGSNWDLVRGKLPSQSSP